MKSDHLLLSLLLATTALGSALPAIAQRDAAAQRRAAALSRYEEDFKTAKNKWMRTPVDIRAQRDSISFDIRRARDDFWDSLISQATLGTARPLSRVQSTHFAITPGPESANPAEFPTIPNGAWVLGKFVGYSTFLSHSELSIYTEISFEVERAFGAGRPYQPRAGEIIQIGRIGGTILAPWGKPVSFLLSPEKFGLQPGRSYLLLISYETQGKFYREGPRIWDVTDGIAEPESLGDYRNANRGRSEIHGKKIPELLDLLNHRLSLQ